MKKYWKLTLRLLLAIISASWASWEEHVAFILSLLKDY